MDDELSPDRRCVPGSDPGGVPVTIWEWEDDKRWQSYPEQIWRPLEAAWLDGRGTVWLDLVMPEKGNRFQPVVVDSTGEDLPTSDNSRWHVNTKTMLQTNISSGFKRRVRRNRKAETLCQDDDRRIDADHTTV